MTTMIAVGGNGLTQTTILVAGMATPVAVVVAAVVVNSREPI